ncbi:GAF domain-containing protein [Streptomyces sp. NBC_00344]|uniref:GAF domain-containing protein n=1 Tax=Streptomyces sp. NBC_00344 TaxID=2975720 RepID=UPI002E21350A
MTDPWVALRSGADPAQRRRTLHGAYEAFASRGRVERPVRTVVAASWQRSSRARVSREGAAGTQLPADELAAYRDGHPLARVMPLFRELMGAYAMDGEHLIAVCDAHGRLLWVEGHAGARREAGRMNFVPGASWAETATGTNAPGTAIAVDRPVQIFAAEHFQRPVHSWTCAAAPIHDPSTGRLIGAVDITGGDRLAHPHSLAFIGAVARAAESQLALLAPAPTTGAMQLSVLGRDEGLLVADGRKLVLSRRHSELLTLLAQRPDGVTGDELLVDLYEDESVTPVTLRAEMFRLRGQLGADLLRSRPYRLAAPLVTDFDQVRRRLASGALASAMSGYPGPLLPGSPAPGVARLRRRISDQLRAALIARADPALLADWAYSPWGEDDLPVWRAFASALPPPQRQVALERLRELDIRQSG